MSMRTHRAVRCMSTHILHTLTHTHTQTHLLALKAYSPSVLFPCSLKTPWPSQWACPWGDNFSSSAPLVPVETFSKRSPPVSSRPKPRAPVERSWGAGVSYPRLRTQLIGGWHGLLLWQWRRLARKHGLRESCLVDLLEWEWGMVWLHWVVNCKTTVRVLTTHGVCTCIISTRYVISSWLFRYFFIAPFSSFFLPCPSIPLPSTLSPVFLSPPLPPCLPSFPLPPFLSFSLLSDTYTPFFSSPLHPSSLKTSNLLIFTYNYWWKGAITTVYIVQYYVWCDVHCVDYAK